MSGVASMALGPAPPAPYAHHQHVARRVVDERAVVLPLGRIGDADQVTVDVVAAGGRARVHLGAGARHRALLVALEALQTVGVGVGVAAVVVRQRVLQHVAGRVVAVVVDVGLERAVALERALVHQTAIGVVLVRAHFQAVGLVLRQALIELGRIVRRQVARAGLRDAACAVVRAVVDLHAIAHHAVQAVQVVVGIRFGRVAIRAHERGRRRAVDGLARLRIARDDALAAGGRDPVAPMRVGEAVAVLVVGDGVALLADSAPPTG